MSAPSDGIDGLDKSHEVYVLESLLDDRGSHRLRGTSFRTLEALFAFKARAVDATVPAGQGDPIGRPPRIILLELPFNRWWGRESLGQEMMRSIFAEPEGLPAQWLFRMEDYPALWGQTSSVPVRFGDSAWFHLTWDQVCFHTGDYDKLTPCSRLSLDNYGVRNLQRDFTNLQETRIIQTPKTLLMSFRRRCPSEKAERGRSTREEIVAACTETGASGTSLAFSELQQLALGKLCNIALEDEDEVLRTLENSIKEINQQLGVSDVVRWCIGNWRHLMGEWRVHLNSKHDLKKQYRQINRVVHGRVEQEGARSIPPFASWFGDVNREADEAYSDREKRIEAVSKYFEATFNAVMTTMGIIESEKAIAEAESVTKLTQLAFFFIPLTFVAGVFGMNLAEFDPDGNGRLKAWYWALSSALLLALTYMMLYFDMVALKVKAAAVAIRRKPKKKGRR